MCVTAPSCWTKASRSATAPAWRVRSTPAPAPGCWAASSARSVFGPECRVRGEVVDQRVPGLRQQGPRRLRRPQRGGALGEPGRGDHDVQSEEHLRRGPPRHRRAPPGDRPAQPRHPLRRSRQDRDRHHAGDGIGDLGGRERLRHRHPAQVRAAVRVGDDGRADDRGRIPHRGRARAGAPQRRVDRDPPRLPAADLPAGRRGNEHPLRAGLGLAGELLRGGARRVRGAHRRRVQRPGDRAAGGARRARARAGRRHRADPRARRPRPRRRPPGPPAGHAGGDRGGHLEPAGAADGDRRAPRPGVLSAAWSWDRSG